MIQISQIKLPCGTDGGPAAGQHPELADRIRKAVRLPKGTTACYRILRHSVDARKKPALYDVYSVGIYVNARGRRQESGWITAPYSGDEDEALEAQIAGRMHQPTVQYRKTIRYQFPETPEDAPALAERPIIVGEGPAGLFCALKLAEAGYRPIVLERGRCIAQRVADVTSFWEGGTLRPQSNIQFGEGGAGTFSDGKLNSGITDKTGRCEEVLWQFIGAGAHPDIAYEFHPHVGTDVLQEVVQNLRHRLEVLGGEVWFETTLTGLQIEQGILKGIICRHADDTRVLPAQAVVLAIGHSARDTFRTLYQAQIPMQQKDFAIGMRFSHPQRLIDERQYGVSDPAEMKRLHLAPASYKLVAQNPSGRAVYSFCMCPGGYVVNASSEPGRLCVNGMSDYLRDSKRANSAIVVTVNKEDFGGASPMDGIRFQETLEEAAYHLADGRIPVESYCDFRDGNCMEGDVDGEALCIKGQAAMAPVHTLLPQTLRENIIRGMETFDRIIPGYAGNDAYVIGLESRTSSPVRIPRDETLQCVGIKGLFPCGEGAGYAGGIMSAAVDGIKAAEAVATQYKPCPL